MLSDKELAEIKERCDKAAPIYECPSHVDGSHPPRHYSIVFDKKETGKEIARFVNDDNHRSDAKFYIDSRTDIPALLDTIAVYKEALHMVLLDSTYPGYQGLDERLTPYYWLEEAQRELNNKKKGDTNDKYRSLVSP